MRLRDRPLDDRGSACATLLRGEDFHTHEVMRHPARPHFRLGWLARSSEEDQSTIEHSRMGEHHGSPSRLKDTARAVGWRVSAADGEPSGGCAPGRTQPNAGGWRQARGKACGRRGSWPARPLEQARLLQRPRPRRSLLRPTPCQGADNSPARKRLIQVLPPRRQKHLDTQQSATVEPRHGVVQDRVDLEPYGMRGKASVRSHSYHPPARSPAPTRALRALHWGSPFHCTLN